MFDYQRILVTGGTGSWGEELITQLLKWNVKEIIVFSRNECAQVAMRRTLRDHRLRFCIGDIRDKSALYYACKNVDYVFHLAALKHVDICEYQPDEALKTNVIGTQYVIEAAIEQKVKKVIYVSTDKAVDAANVYGMTKAIGEKLIVHANLLQSDTKFVTIRGGNVLGTNGSVVHLFKEQMREKGQVYITDLKMTRFFLTLPDAIHLLLKAATESYGGEIMVMIMPSCCIVDLATVLIECSGQNNVEMIESGKRPGEKIHEMLTSECENLTTVVYDENYLVVLPTLCIPGLNEKYDNYPKVEATPLSSQHLLMSKKDIAQMLQRGGFIQT